MNQDDRVFTLHRGHTPLVVSIPHTATELTDTVRDACVARAERVEDTDWHLDQLYDFVHALGASVLLPRYGRYVIDLNRPPENTPMYSGANNTELCPTRFFTGEPLYREGRAPKPADVADRLQRYWQPYHAALKAELERVRKEHGHVVLFDAHSIHSELPWLFDGGLPDLNLGTAGGASCATSLRDQLAGVLDAQTRFSYVVDGRFKGGYITRHYGRPEASIHAVQLEMCWCCYMAETPPFELDPQRVALIRPVLEGLVQTMLTWRPAPGETRG